MHSASVTKLVRYPLGLNLYARRLLRLVERLAAANLRLIRSQHGRHPFWRWARWY